MKNFRIRKYVTFLLIICVTITTSGINLLLSAEDTNNLSFYSSVNVNNGDGTGKNNIIRYASSVTEYSIANDVSPDGAAMCLTGVADRSFTQDLLFNCDTSLITDLTKVRALSFWVKVPKLDNGKLFNLAPRAGASSYHFYTTFYTVSKDGEIKKYDNSFGVKLSDFEGTVIAVIPENGVALKYNGTTDHTWKEHCDNISNKISSIPMYFYVPSSIINKNVYFDSFKFHYSLDTALSQAKNAYSPKHVVNDGSGKDKNTFNSYNNKVFESSVVQNISPEEDALSLKVLTNESINENISLNLDKSSITDLSKMQALSFWIKVPKTTHDLTLIPKACTNDDYFCGDIFTIGDKGEVKYYKGTPLQLNNFEGNVIVLIPSDVSAVKSESGLESTWSEYLEKQGGEINSFAISLNSTDNIKDESIMFDSLSFYTDTKQLFIDNGIYVNSPVSSCNSGIVTKGTQIELTSDNNTNIYYTTDGSDPTKQSEKYDVTHKPVINTDTVIKAIAYNGSVFSEISTYEYIILTPDMETKIMLNDGTDASTVSFGKADNLYEIKSVDGVSNDGAALSINGKAQSGYTNMEISLKSNGIKNLDSIEAFAFWVSIPEGIQYKFAPSINSEKYNFCGHYWTYNTSTGEYSEYKTDKHFIILSGFEGYIICKTDGNCVATDFGLKNPTTWSDYINNYGFSKLTYYISNTELYNKELLIDSIIAIPNLNIWYYQMQSKGLRPTMPSANPESGFVNKNTSVILKSQDDTSIYYTLDGSIPTTHSFKYVETSMGEGQPTASPIVILDDCVLKAIAVREDGTSSGIATFTYEIDPPYTGPNNVIINNGSGNGKNTINYFSTINWDSSYISNDSEDGKGIQLKAKTDKSIVGSVVFNIDSSAITQPRKIEAISFNVKLPALPNKQKWVLSPRVSGEKNYLQPTTIYAIDKDGTVIKATDTIKLNQFYGKIVMTIEKNTTAVSTNYGTSNVSWSNFVKTFGFNNIGFYFSRGEVKGDFETEVVWDEFAVHYDLKEYFNEINLDGLLASYNASTFENTNMMVSNDCSGNRINSGLKDFSKNLIVNKSDESPDERCISLQFSKGKSNISLLNYCTEMEAQISDGITFWVSAPKNVGDIDYNLDICDSNTGSNEYFTYADKWFYLIDAKGTITKKFGKLYIPKNFRGWIIIPNDNIKYDENNINFNDGILNYNTINSVSLTFENSDNCLNGKNLLLDDISFYTSFTDLVQSHAIKWDESTITSGVDDTSKDSLQTFPSTGNRNAIFINSLLVSMCSLFVLVLQKKKV